jgi:hypothetical protein
LKHRAGLGRSRVACLNLSSSRVRLAVTVLLLISAIFVSVSSINNMPFVEAAASISLSPAFAGRGSVVTFSGSGFSLPNGTALVNPIACNLFSLDQLNNPGTLISSPICSVSGSSISGSFVVKGNISPIKNPYAVIVNVTDAKSHFIKAQRTFTVTAIIISPPVGARGQTIKVNGSIGGSDTTCSLSGSVVGTSSCVMYGSTGGNFSGSFVVAYVSPGPYTVRVTSSPSGTFVETSFTVTGPSITLTPPKGVIGAFIGVNGTGFSFADTTCSITSPTSGSVLLNSACSINSGTGKVKGNFTVGNVSPGAYVIRVTGSPYGDFAEATFQVTSGPSINLKPWSGTPGTVIQISGTGFLPSDTACSITGSGGVATTAACSIVAGTGAPKGNFTIGNVVPGSYLIIVTGNHGDYAQNTTQVTITPLALTLTPSNATEGSTVTFRGIGFSTADRSCSVSSSPTTVLIASSTCSMSSGVATGSFVVGSTAGANVAWVVTVTGSPTIDKATASFGVIPEISISPTSGSSGTVVSFSGSGFSSSATFCNVTLIPTIIGYFTAAHCGIIGPGQVSGSFIVASAAQGVYIANVTDNALTYGSPHNFAAGAPFTVGAPITSITIYPNVVVPGQSVGVSGYGFNAGDTKCTILPKTIATSGVCTISGGIVAGSFIAAGNPGYYVITVNATSGDFATNFLEIAVTTGTLTITSSPTTTSVTTTTATSFTTSIPVTLTTTTFTSTGISTYISYTLTSTTITGQSTSSISTVTTTTSIETSSTTTTITTTLSTTATVGAIVSPPTFSSQGFDGNIFGLISLMSLLGWVLVRRLVL